MNSQECFSLGGAILGFIIGITLGLNAWDWGPVSAKTPARLWVKIKCFFGVHWVLNDANALPEDFIFKPGVIFEIPQICGWCKKNL